MECSDRNLAVCSAVAFGSVALPSTTSAGFPKRSQKRTVSRVPPVRVPKWMTRVPSESSAFWCVRCRWPAPGSTVTGYIGEIATSSAVLGEIPALDRFVIGVVRCHGLMLLIASHCSQRVGRSRQNGIDAGGGPEHISKEKSAITNPKPTYVREICGATDHPSSLRRRIRRPACAAERNSSMGVKNMGITSIIGGDRCDICCPEWPLLLWMPSICMSLVRLRSGYLPLTYSSIHPR